MDGNCGGTRVPGVVLSSRGGASSISREAVCLICKRARSPVGSPAAKVLAADAALVRPVPDEPGAVAHVVRLAVLGLLLRGGGGGERVVLRVGVRHDGFPSSPRRTAWSG